MKSSQMKSLKIKFPFGVADCAPFARAILLSAFILLSPIAKLAHAQSCFSSSGAFTNAALGRNATGTFRVTFDSTPSSATMDAVAGLSAGAAFAYTSIAADVRFNTRGTIDVRNGGTFTAANIVKYSPGLTYHFILDVNVTTHTYSVHVVRNSIQTTLGTNVAFRSETSSVTFLSFAVVRAAQGTLNMCNITYTSTSTPTGASLTASPVSLNFGGIHLSTTSNQNITLTNSGQSNISITKVTVAGSGFTASGSAAGLTLSPGKTATVAASFTPPGTGTYTGSITVGTSTNSSALTIALSGSGISATAHSVLLSWLSSGSGIAGYNIYVSSTSGGPYTRLNGSFVGNTSYSDSTVQSGHTYYYVVTTVSSTNIESARSSEVRAVVP